MDIKQTDVSFSCVCPVVDDEFRHNKYFNVKIFCCQSSLRIHEADPQLLLQFFDEIHGQTHEKLTSIC